MRTSGGLRGRLTSFVGESHFGVDDEGSDPWSTRFPNWSTEIAIVC